MPVRLHRITGYSNRARCSPWFTEVVDVEPPPASEHNQSTFWLMASATCWILDCADFSEQAGVVTSADLGMHKFDRLLR